MSCALSRYGGGRFQRVCRRLNRAAAGDNAVPVTVGGHGVAAGLTHSLSSQIPGSPAWNGSPGWCAVADIWRRASFPNGVKRRASVVDALAPRSARGIADPPAPRAIDPGARAVSLVQRGQHSADRVSRTTTAATRRPTHANAWTGAPSTAACGELMRMVACDYTPALLVGVRTGGLVVAETMAEQASPPLPVLPLTCRRPSTSFKSRFPGLRPLLAVLPEPLLNALRRAEHRLTSGHRRAARPTEIDLDEAIAIGNWLRMLPRGARVLVVDDAVDSGSHAGDGAANSCARRATRSGSAHRGHHRNDREPGRRAGLRVVSWRALPVSLVVRCAEREADGIVDSAPRC